jgi:hypothetical protein
MESAVARDTCSPPQRGSLLWQLALYATITEPFGSKYGAGFVKVLPLCSNQLGSCVPGIKPTCSDGLHGPLMLSDVLIETLKGPLHFGCGGGLLLLVLAVGLQLVHVVQFRG